MNRESPRRSVEEWRAIVKRSEASGKTQREFCEAESVSHSSLGYWRKKFAAPAALSPRKSEAPFIELQNSKRSARWELEVVLPNGTMMRFGGEA